MQTLKTNKATTQKSPTKIKLPVDGILLVDKPTGKTSNYVLQQIKRLFNANKAGHTGSLDPLASGMLPICFGKATKFAQYLLDSDKHYLAEATLGVTTTTGDTDGEIVQQRPVAKITDQALHRVLEKFHGQIQQVPPMYSALKHQGQPLYKLARQGVTVERKERTVTIHRLDLLRRTETTLLIEVFCSKGTYIRTLVEDIGKHLFCGATISMLRRANVATFSNHPMYTIESLEQIAAEQGQDALESLLLPMSHAIECLPEVVISETERLYLEYGKPFKVQQTAPEGFVKVRLESDRIWGVGELSAAGKLQSVQMIRQSS